MTAYGDLEDWCQRRAAVEKDRPTLILNAFTAGLTVAQIARASGLSRDTVYADLRTFGLHGALMPFTRFATPSRLTGFHRAGRLAPGSPVAIYGQGLNVGVPNTVITQITDDYFTVDPPVMLKVSDGQSASYKLADENGIMIGTTAVAELADQVRAAR